MIDDGMEGKEKEHISMVVYRRAEINSILKR